jgi:hypothetical protein
MSQGTTDAEIERAVDEGRILRTHVMRPTWHFVTPTDIRWMLELTAPRVHRVVARYARPVVAYRERDAVPHTADTRVSSSRGMVRFQHALVMDGQVAGTWKPVRKEEELVVDVVALRRLSGRERRALADTTARYGRFLNIPVTLSVDVTVKA